MRKRTLFAWGIVAAVGLCLTPAAWADDPGESLMTAVMYNEPQQVAALLEKGADVNYRAPGSGSTPLMMACTYGFSDIARLLIEKGADVNLQAENGATALIGACRRHPEVAKLLLANGAKVDIVSAATAGPFTAAVLYALGKNGDTSLAALLLEKGADVNEAPTKGRLAGYTPLMMAAGRNSMEVVRFLVENGADVDARAEDGSTALSTAGKAKSDPIVEYLKRKGAK